MGIREKRRRANLAAQFFLLIVALVGLLVGGFLVFVYLSGATERRLGPGAEDLNPAERAVLMGYLTARADDLDQSAGSDNAPVLFSVAPGTSAEAVADELAGLGLVMDAQLLTYYLRYQGLDGQVEAGDFILRQTMTIAQVAEALTDATAREAWLRVTEGWRREQIAAALEAQGIFADVADDFALLSGPNSPRAPSYSFLAGVPAAASLEGYLFPDTYLLHPDATASEIIDKMLANFQARLPANYEAQAAIELEAIADPGEQAAYPFEVGEGPIDPRPALFALLHDRESGCGAAVISARFHNGVARMVRATCEAIRQREGLDSVALSGGVWQNMTLLSKTVAWLESADFSVYVHRQVPTNDGGLALGQAVVAHHMLK